MAYKQKIVTIDSFHYNIFLPIWKGFWDGDVQLKVDNILSFHYVMKLMHIYMDNSNTF
jgi:hypothetical protein